jgi:NADPH:quinone reductase-like Zn-dependent oxidoreductase
MKAAIFDRFGEPEQVLHISDVPAPSPGRGEVRVRMLASPINPSDLMVVRGQYGRLPRLPATPGFEGVGVIESTGPGLIRLLRGLKPGRRVAVINGRGGNWQEYVTIPARQAIPVPAELTDEQAATFFVNPASALVMTRHVLKIPRGAWLLQTAAGSALGRMVIRLGKREGFRTMNVVRRREQADELRSAGADAVICTSDESIEPRVQELTAGAGVPFAIDAVGGETGSAVLRSLANEGRMLVYGTLSSEPMRIESRILMTGSRRVEGFWLSNWMSQQGVVTLLGLFRQIGDLLKQGILTSEVGATFALEDIHAAVRAAEQPGRTGKVLLQIG